MDTTSDLQLGSLHTEQRSSTTGAAQNGTKEQTILQGMARFRQNPFDFAHELYLFIRGVDWRAYDDIIGQPVFYPGYTAKIKQTTMSSPLLQRKLEELTEHKLKSEEAEHLLDRESPVYHAERARRKQEISRSLLEYTGKMVDNMMCKMESKLQIRTAFYMCTQLLTRVYSGVHVAEKEVIRLRTVATKAAEQKMPIVFLPRHSSHIDYVTLQLICYRLGMTLPVVVAGDNLNFPLVGAFLQHAGAMWIRRSFGGDALYATLVQAYLDSMLQEGYNLECFIEGGRSRTGKLLQPKFGFLSFLLDSIISGRTKDAYICPVSIQYDKVIEVDSYVTEMLGKPKQKENLADFLSSSSILGLNLGRIDCRFHEPWSLRGFIDQQLSRIDGDKTSMTSAQTQAPELRMRLLRTLGYRVLADINSASVVMPTALVGTVLLTLRGRGVGRSELARRVEWLCTRIIANGGNVADFHGLPTSTVVDRALAVLGPKLVGTTEGLVEETYYAVDRFQLSFYRNMTIHLFIPEALIATALYTRVKQGGGQAAQQILESDLTEQVTFLSQLFRGEFIFPAGQGLQYNLAQALERLVKDEVLMRSRANGVSHIGLSMAERERGRENFDFYCFLLWPFVDAAWLGAVSLYCLVPPEKSTARWVDMKQAQNTAQKLGRTLYHQGDLSYFEAINTEALKNAYSRFQEEGIIRVSKIAGVRGGLSVQIAPDWMPQRDPDTGAPQAEGTLWNFVGRVSAHRREGKNRRDGASVSARVLRLAAMLNTQLFEQTETLSGHDVEVEKVKESKQRRSRL